MDRINSKISFSTGPKTISNPEIFTEGSFGNTSSSKELLKFSLFFKETAKKPKINNLKDISSLLNSLTSQYFKKLKESQSKFKENQKCPEIKNSNDLSKYRYLVLRDNYHLEVKDNSYTYENHKKCRICRCENYIGNRMKCSECKNFELCEGCYLQNHQKHKHIFQLNNTESVPQYSNELKRSKDYQPEFSPSEFSVDIRKGTEDYIAKFKIQNAGEKAFGGDCLLSFPPSSDIQGYDFSKLNNLQPGQELDNIEMKIPKLKDLQEGYYLVKIGLKKKKDFYGKFFIVTIHIIE